MTNTNTTNGDDEVQQQQQQQHIYPIPQPLTNVLTNAYSNTSNCKLDSIPECVEQLIGNAFHALDAMYFTTPGAVRSECPGFVARMIVRVDLMQKDSGNGGRVMSLLSITDLGVGMTRADLINVFGVGSVQQQGKKGKVDCTSANLGGFYAAFCTMAKNCVISTKSKFDDYYEFRIDGPGFETFTITKPISQEGQLPMPEVGYDQFSDVRGESGTRVLFELNDATMEVLKDEADLRKMMEHIFETSHYNVIFSHDEEAKNVVAKDVEMVQQLAKSLINDPSSMEDYALEDQQVDDAIPVIVLERSKYIPIRLSMAERKMLRLIDAAMHCCDYTNVVDVPYKSKMKRINSMFKGIQAILTGSVLACDYEAGQKLANDKGATFSDFEKFYQQLFEITRRHKIMNPEKMRTEYGKFVYFLQDAIAHTDDLELQVLKPIESVYRFLEVRRGLGLLKDPLIVIATSEVLATKGKSRAQIDNEIRKKERAVNQLKQKYKAINLSTDDIHMCLYSICDNDSFLNSNRVPIDEIIGYLKQYFKPNQIEEGFSLSIISGKNGSRLSHSHERQYYFALQSLTLWRDIIHEMFYLWHMAEEDLLSETVGYELKDTGQGMQRIQSAPKTYRAMQGILRNVQQKVNQWVGSSVIHMGDHNVPNALMFIDKYTQVPRILSPIVRCIENLEQLYEKDEGIQLFVKSAYGSVDHLKKTILYDFFRSAFDGSGADNFYDAGSCIDGRLTSAWNWCSLLPTKDYYIIFRLTGFIGFDGEFK